MRSLREGNVFSHVCLSICSQGRDIPYEQVCTDLLVGGSPCGGVGGCGIRGNVAITSIG